MQLKKKGKGIAACRQLSAVNQSPKNTKNFYYTCNYMKNKENVSNFTTGRYGSKFKQNNCTDSVRNSQHPTERGVGREFTNHKRSVKKTVPPAEKKQSTSQKFTLIPDSENSSLHSAETTHSDTNSETDDECNLPASEQNSQHAAESDKTNLQPKVKGRNSELEKGKSMKYNYFRKPYS